MPYHSVYSFLFRSNYFFATLLFSPGLPSQHFQMSSLVPKHFLGFRGQSGGCLVRDLVCFDK